ncbi:sensor histidine kinase [Dactylosporangium sp. NPDC049525]|uniref:sensor histidine kinase n=1 Tax=Dactylosporangium sp. NPDC049525 TaxID=3154730 RepID=UPI003417F438
MRHLAALHAMLRGGAPAAEVLDAVCDRARRALPATAVLIVDAAGAVRTVSQSAFPTDVARHDVDAVVAEAVRTARPARRGVLCGVPLPGPAGVLRSPGVLIAAGRRRPTPAHRVEMFAAVAALALGTGEHQAIRERERLARELHDSVVQTLYGISLGAGTAAELMHGDPANARASLAWIQETASAGLSDLRGIIVRLRPETLVGAGLAEALRRIVDALHFAPGTGAVPPGWGLQLDAEPAVSPQVEEALYRIALEALGNAARHAGASQVTVRLAGDDTRVVLEVVDDGVGFQPGASAGAGRLGLRSMRERAELVNGTLDVMSAPGAGTVVRAILPSSAAVLTG